MEQIYKQRQFRPKNGLQASTEGVYQIHKQNQPTRANTRHGRRRNSFPATWFSGLCAELPNTLEAPTLVPQSSAFNSTQLNTHNLQPPILFHIATFIPFDNSTISYNVTVPSDTNRPNGAFCGPPEPNVSMPRVLCTFWTTTPLSLFQPQKLNVFWYALARLVLVRQFAALSSWSRMQFLYCHHSLSIRGPSGHSSAGTYSDRQLDTCHRALYVGEDMSALSNNGLTSNPAAHHASLTFVGEGLEIFGSTPYGRYCTLQSCRNGEADLNSAWLGSSQHHHGGYSTDGPWSAPCQTCQPLFSPDASRRKGRDGPHICARHQAICTRIYSCVGQDMGVTRQEIDTTLVHTRTSQVGGMRIHPGALVHGRVVLTTVLYAPGFRPPSVLVTCLSASGHDRLTTTS